MSHTTENVAAIIKAARNLVSTADEHFPEHPAAVGEALGPLIDAIDRLGDPTKVVHLPLELIDYNPRRDGRGLLARFAEAVRRRMSRGGGC